MSEFDYHKRGTNAWDVPPIRMTAIPANIPALGSGTSSPPLIFPTYCGWIYVESDGGADLYVAPGRSGGGYTTQVRTGSVVFVGDGQCALFYGTTAPTTLVSVIGAVSQDAFVLATGRKSVASQSINPGVAPIPGSPNGQAVSGGAALTEGVPTLVPNSAPGFTTNFVNFPTSNGGIAFGNTAAASQAANAPFISPGGQWTWNGTLYLCALGTACTAAWTVG